MKKTLAIMLALIMVLAMVPALADDPPTSGYCGGDANADKIDTITGTTWVYGKQTNFSIDIYKNVSWRLDENETGTYTLTLSGSGVMADYLAGKVRPWKDYAERITKLVVENGVSSIGSRTCYGFTALTEVVLADTVTDIGEYSFSGCTALSSIDLSNVTSIRANAMRADTALSAITLSPNLKVIGYQAFRDSGAGNSSISIPASVTEIGFGAFSGAKFTNALNLPNVEKVGAFAFSNSKFAAVVLTNANLAITTGKEENSGNEIDNSVFSNNSAVFYTSVPDVMDKLYDGNRKNNIGIIACTNGGSFTPDTKFGGFTLAVPQKDGYAFAGWFSDPDLTKTEGLSEEDGTYTGTPTTNIHADGRRYYAKWEEIPGLIVIFNANGGSVNPQHKFYASEGGSEEVTISELPTPTRSGYTFAGWFTATETRVNENSTLPMFELSGDEQKPIRETTLYAHWTEQESGGGNGGGYYNPTTTPVPVIVIPPKTGDMTIWQGILHFLGIR